MAQKKGGNTIAAVTKLVMPLIEQQNLILWDVRFEKEGAMWLLRIILDKEGGITIDDCEALSRPLDKLLDDADPIEQAYCLEVASAGLERELTKPWHYESCKGQKACLKLIRPLEDTKEREFIGAIIGLADNIVTIEVDSIERSFALNEVSYVRLYVEF